MLCASVSPQPSPSQKQPFFWFLSLMIHFACSKNSCKWNNSICTPLCSTFLHSAQCFCSLSMLLHVPVIYSFLWSSSIPLCRCATISLPISYCQIFRSLLVWSCYEYNCYKHSCTSLYINIRFHFPWRTILLNYYSFIISINIYYRHSSLIIFIFSFLKWAIFTLFCQNMPLGIFGIW